MVGIKNINSNKYKQRRKAFTLAEVLITLGILGVISAAVIPTLISNYRAKRNITQFKKAISALSQVAIGGLAENSMNFGGAVSPCSENGGEDSTDQILSLCALFNDSLLGKAYVKDVSTIKADKGADYVVTKAAQNSGLSFLPEDGTLENQIAYRLADGTLFVFPAGAYNCTAEGTKCYGFIDVNGGMMPNKEVTCNGGDANAEDCEVPQLADNVTDIFPVVFYGSTIEPATAAGKYLLRYDNSRNVDRSGRR